MPTPGDLHCEEGRGGEETAIMKNIVHEICSVCGAPYAHFEEGFFYPHIGTRITGKFERLPACYSCCESFIWTLHELVGGHR